jgi:serine/threonine protein phosphatase 1
MIQIFQLAISPLNRGIGDAEFPLAEDVKPHRWRTSLVDADNRRVYVIGDIHGRSDLVDRIVDEIRRDLEKKPAAESLTVTLGDYIDRGPDSRGVLERLAQNPFPTEYIALKGNHEELFETFLSHPAIASQWRHLGGLETLHSYKVPLAAVMIGKGFDEASNALRQALPDKHLKFLKNLKLSLAIGKYFLCHAGVRPGVPLEEQKAADLLSIREEFLNSKNNFGKIIVHGHTPTKFPEVFPTRINIDTGAFATGRLTCLVIEGGSRRFLWTR